MAEYSKDEIRKIEEKWRAEWEKRKVYKTEADPSRPKYYVLDMFPYPSGAGLHVGHPLGYIASDIVARFKRLKGFNVLHPMGFDAFGLPAEQYAIEHGIHPAISTAQNIENFKRQMAKIGYSYDWSREVQTCDPKYYRWTQWIFLQIFDSWYNRKKEKAERISQLIKIFEAEGNVNHPFPNSKFQIPNSTKDSFTGTDWKSFSEKQKQEIFMQYRLAYLAYTDVNWCEALGTVLANDEVINGVSYRGGFPVVKRQMRQWSLRITEYAERLLKGLEEIDFSDSMKDIQRNWIGKSTGAKVTFAVKSERLTPNPSPVERGYETSEKKHWQYLKEFSRENRKNPTEAETTLWEKLRNNQLGHKIRRQHAIGVFIADFVCLDRRLVIEVDGDYHLNNKDYDRERTEFLNLEGFNVIRFSNIEVQQNLANVLAEIKQTLDKSPSIKEGISLSSGEGRGEALNLTVFTTRPDTIFGVDFMVVAPEHEIVKEITSKAQQNDVDQYLKYVESRSEVERMAEVKKITGAFTGAYAINPFNKREVPIWISEYVLAGYGTGAIMGVPCGDERDHKFAKHFKLPITNIIGSHYTGEDANPTKEAVLENSDFLNGVVMHKAIDIVIEKLEQLGIGQRQVNFKMRDAGWSRQRYWGEPFPVIFKDDMPYAMKESELPLELPKLDNFKSPGNGEGPLGNVPGWKESGKDTNTMPTHAGAAWYFLRYMDPHNDQEFAGKKSLDYWGQVDVYVGGSEHAVAHLLYARLWIKILCDLGYINFDEPFKKLINQGKITGVSQFIREIRPDPQWMKDHTQREELRLNVYKKGAQVASFDVLINEPGHNRYVSHDSSSLDFKYQDKNTNALIPTGSQEVRAKFDFVDFEGSKYYLNIDRWLSKENYTPILFNDNAYWDSKIGSWKVYDDNSVNNADFKIETRSEIEKMSKSYYNVVNPDDVIDTYGADTLRMYEMFLGPLEASKPWNTNGIDGVYKFLRRFWNLIHDSFGNLKVSEEAPTKEELKIFHKTIKKVEQDMENYSFNTSVSEFMICTNELTSLKCNKRAIIEPLVVALAPFAPHMCEELWEKLGHKDFVLNAAFPKYDEQYLKENSFEYPISINGKVRTMMNFALDMPKEDMEKVVMASEIVMKWTEGKAPKKVIIVQGKIVNIVV